MSFVLGLTGGIASGKSTVSHYFLGKNIPVVDADLIAKEVVEPRTPGLAKIISHFGSSILTATGELDRKKLGVIIFNNEEERVELNNILHGEIERRVDQLLSDLKQEDYPLIIMDIPLLYEVDYQYKCDEVMTVFVSQKTQINRLIIRNSLSNEQAMDRINSQMPLIDKALLSDVIIDNEGSIENTRLQVDRWLTIFEQTR